MKRLLTLNVSNEGDLLMRRHNRRQMLFAHVDARNSARRRLAPWPQLTFAIVLSAFMTLPARAQSAPSCPTHKALTLDQVLNFVNQKIPEERTLQYIQSCHVSFPMNAPTVEKLAQAGASERILDSLNQLTSTQLTLDLAKAEVAELTAFLQSEPTGARRDAALKQLDADYQTQRATTANIAPKGQFEPTRDYEARVQRSQSDLAALDSKHQSDRAALSAQFAAQAAESDKPYQSRIAFLEKATYPDPRSASYTHYNPDTGQLTASIGPDAYSFDNVPPKSAESLYNHWKQVQVRQPFADDDLHHRELAIAGESTAIPGYSTAAKAAFDKQCADAQTARNLNQALTQARADLSKHAYEGALRGYRAAHDLDANNAEANQEIAAIQALLQRRIAILQEQKAAGTWVDPEHQRMWPMQDNGSDINWKGAGEYCQALHTGGFSDWHLPSSSEIEPIYRGGVTRMTQAHTHTNITILTSNTGQIAQKVTVPAKAYHIAGDIQLTEVLLWTTNKGNDKGEYLLADFNKGNYAEDLPNSKKDYRALCVRSYTPPADAADLDVPAAPLPAEPPASSCVADNTPAAAPQGPTIPVTQTAQGQPSTGANIPAPPANLRIYHDPTTGRMWTAQDNGSSIGYVEAAAYCASLRLGGFSDWRLPVEDELAGLYDRANTRPPDCRDPLNGRAQPYPVRIRPQIILGCYQAWSTTPGHLIPMPGHPDATIKTFNFYNGAPYDTRPVVSERRDSQIRALCTR